MTVQNYHSIKQLLKLAKSEANKRLAQRIQVIALAKQGFTCPQIVQMTGYCRRAIQIWVARYNKSGIEGIRDKPRSGRFTKLSRKKQAQLCARIDAGPKPSDGTATLCGKDIQRILQKEFDALYSLDGVYKLLHRLGYSCLKPRPKHKKADPVIQEEFKKTSPGSWMKSNQNIRAKK